MGILLFYGAVLAGIFIIVMTIAGLLNQIETLIRKSLDWYEKRSITLVLKSKQIEGQYARLWLALPNGKRLPRYRGGDSLSLTRPSMPPVKRRYSLAGWDKNPHQYELLIKREENGKVSGWVHDDLQEGDLVKITRPIGEFRLNQTAGVRIFIAAGVGITPLRAMLQESLNRQFQRSLLFWSVRSEQDLSFYHDEFKAFDNSQARFTYRPIVTASTNWQGESARIDIQRVIKEVPANAIAGIWICTAPAMAEALKAQAIELGIRVDRIHFEAFGSGAIGGGANAEVQLAPDGKKFAYEGQPTLLHMFDDAGIDIPQDCRAGHCGACALRVISGDIREVLTANTTLQSGQVLACCVQPVGTLEVGRV